MNIMDQGLQSHRIQRDKHPAVTLYWMAESIERGRPVLLHTLYCMFCGRMLSSELKGNFQVLVNAPVNVVEFGMAMTLRCKLCKQNYRVVVTDSFLG
jgi:transcription elongation factor Elf1